MGRRLPARARPHRTVWLRSGLVVLGGLLVVALLYTFVVGPRAALKGLPEPDLTGAEEQVVQKIDAARRAVQAWPRDAQAWGHLGVVLDVHGLPAEAVVCYRQAAQLDSREFLWPYLCAIALQVSGSQEAQAWWERALAVRDDYAPLQVRYGQALLQRRQLEPARAHFAQAVALDARAVFAHLGLAQVALMQDDPRTSRTHLDMALAIQPSFRQAHGLLAELHRRLGHIELMERQRGALAELPEALALPDPILQQRWAAEGVSASWHNRRGTDHSRRGDHARAVEEYRQALAARPQADYHNNLAAALFQLGRRDEALRSARKALELDPTSSKAYANLATFALQLGRAQDAFAALREGLVRVPGEQTLRWTLAWALVTAPDEHLRNPAEAARILEELLAAGGRRDLRTLGLLAGAYAASGDLGRAVATDREALQRARAVGQREAEQKIRSRIERYGATPP